METYQKNSLKNILIMRTFTIIQSKQYHLCLKKIIWKMEKAKL